MTRATHEVTRTDARADAPAGAAWRRTPGLEVLGQVQDSGLRDAAFLVRRYDDQVVQLSRLLYLVVVYVEPDRTPDEVANLVSAAHGRTLTPEGLEHVVVNRLEPLGLVESCEADGPISSPRANPLLSLTVKGTLVPPGLVDRLARTLSPLFWPPVVLCALVAMAALDVLVARQGDFWAAVTELFRQPTLALVMYAVLTSGAVLHELGHAAACRYGGARPGAIGVGIYIVFPAFYTDVTDSYRLDRAGRIRTDLGGLYFNVLCVIALAVAYLQSGYGLLLLTLVVMQIQMLQQLIPVVRFDGYYVLADLAGVPDLFSRVGPVMRSLWPGTPADPRVTELTPTARRLVTGWVVVVVPTLTAVVAWALWHLPAFVDQARAGLEIQQLSFEAAWAQDDWPMLVLAVLSVALILLPLLGLAVVLWRLLGMGARLLGVAADRLSGPEDDHGADLAGPEWRDDAGIARAIAALPVPGKHSAADFTDDVMLPARAAVPREGWRRTVYVASGRLVNPGPSRQELRRAALKERLRTPIRGSRRVVVMSRKGGVGKTTVALALGSIFAMLRGDRVAAVDANPDAGNLAHRVVSRHDRKITDLLREADSIDSYAVLREYTAQAEESRLEVLASDDDPRIGQALGRNDYHTLITLLDRFYNLILLDTGTGILDSANQGLLQEADQLVLVLGPGLDGGRAAALTLDWLDEHGLEDLVTHAVVVINGLRKGGETRADPMRRHFEQRCERVLTVPWDPALESGALTNLSGLRVQTHDSFVQVAAAVADNFREQGATR